MEDTAQGGSTTDGLVGTLYTVPVMLTTNALTGKVDMTPDEIREVIDLVVEDVLEKERTNPLSESNVRCAVRLSNADQKSTVAIAEAIRKGRISGLEEDKISRVEVIDNRVPMSEDGITYARAYSAWDVQVRVALQDDDRTLKVFVDTKK